jgi:tetratricopeptide (TPR) repeat protein
MASPYAMIARRLMLGALLLVLATAPAIAVTMGGESERPAPGEEDAYTEGAAAFEREDWQAVVDHMTEAVEQRPWHDDAYNLMGFAYRKLGDYDRALQAYDRALALNPHHRGALEYLGEAYLELDQPARAQATLERLEVECKRTAAGAASGGWQSGCEEWQELSEAYEGYLARREASHRLRARSAPDRALGPQGTVE